MAHGYPADGSSTAVSGSSEPAVSPPGTPGSSPDFADVTLVAATDVDPARSAAFAEQFGTAVTDDVAALLEHDLRRRVRVRAAVRAHPGRDVRRGADRRRRAAAVRREAARAGPGDRRGDREAAATAPACSPGSATTGAARSRWRGPARCSPTGRSGSCPRPGGTRCRRWRGGCTGTGPGGPVVEQAIHVLDLARVLVGEVTEVSGAAPAAPCPAATSTPRRPRC